MILGNRWPFLLCAGSSCCDTKCKTRRRTLAMTSIVSSNISGIERTKVRRSDRHFKKKQNTAKCTYTLNTIHTTHRTSRVNTSTLCAGQLHTTGQTHVRAFVRGHHAVRTNSLPIPNMCVHNKNQASCLL